MTRNENQMYSNISSIAKSLEKIANVLEHVNHDSYLAKQDIPEFPKVNEDLEYLKAVKCSEFSSERKAKLTKDIPGFEGTLDALDNLTNLDSEIPNGPEETKDYAKEVLDAVKVITDDYASKENLTNMTDARDYYKEKYESLKELHELKLHTDEGPQDDDHIHNEYLEEIVKDMNHIQYLNFHHEMAFGFPSSDTAALSQHIYELEYEEVLGAIKTALLIKGDSDYIESVECSGFDKDRKDKLAKDYIEGVLDGFANQKASNNDPYTYDNDLNEYVDGIKNDSDHDIRSTAAYYEDAMDSVRHRDLKTKKDCILDYVTNEFGLHGARYTDIIKFAYYLGAPNALKYSNSNRGYYACAFNVKLNGHLIQGGKDFLVKGINNEGKERYFAHSSVDNFTDYYKRIA